MLRNPGFSVVCTSTREISGRGCTDWSKVAERCDVSNKSKEHDAGTLYSFTFPTAPCVYLCLLLFTHSKCIFRPLIAVPSSWRHPTVRGAQPVHLARAQHHRSQPDPHARDNRKPPVALPSRHRSLLMKIEVTVVMMRSTPPPRPGCCDR